MKTALCAAAASVALVSALAPAQEEPGFAPLFNGKDLTGWTGDTRGYAAEDGKLVCRPGGNLYTARQYTNFVLRFEFRLTPGANNGIGIRTPLYQDAAYAGMEIQVLDDSADQYKTLHPYQFHGSIYGVVPSERGHQAAVGEWNREEISAIGSRIKVVLNGATIVDADVARIRQTDQIQDLGQHPGLRNKAGHIGLLGHGSVVEFRNLRVQEFAGELPAPPEGFAALFNGVDLAGWQGLMAPPNDNPLKRAQLTPEARAAAQAEADESLRAHWRVEDGALVFDGKGRSLATARDYTNFELRVDWKILPAGDSGIYLRGTPQVQIWDFTKHPEGSGGLYNNQNNPSRPLVCADKPIGEWNTFEIRMVDERVNVKLNGRLVVDNVVLENFWDRGRPVLPSGPIELQNHGNTLWFRNVFIREL